MGKYQFIYFAIRGRAEPIRLLFRDNGIDFDEIIVDEDAWPKEWKPKMIFSQLPCLKDNGLELVQSNSILRHLARKHGLYGNSLEEAALIDMINDGIEDWRVKYYRLIYTNYEEGKDAYISSLPSQLQPFETLLARNGADKSGCCVGDKKSYADYNLTDMLENYLALAPKCLDDFPVLSAFRKLNLARPGIVEYHQTEGYKQRRINGNGKE